MSEETVLVKMTAIELISNLQETNDDLLEALEEMMDLAAYYFDEAQEQNPLLAEPGQFRNAKATIARAKGES